MNGRTSEALASGDAADTVSLSGLQRWCASNNAQVICNPDGTVYVATGETLRAELCEPGSLAAAVSRAHSDVRCQRAHVGD